MTAYSVYVCNKCGNDYLLENEKGVTCKKCGHEGKPILNYRLNCRKCKTMQWFKIIGNKEISYIIQCEKCGHKRQKYYTNKFALTHYEIEQAIKTENGTMSMVGSRPKIFIM